MTGTVILSHGFESGPGASKTTAMGEVAARMGWQVVHADYREFDVLGLAGCVKPRCRHLLQLAGNVQGPLLLAGSSMGAFVSGWVSLQVTCVGLFLLATPIRGYEHPLDVADVPLTLVHGFADDVCPFEPVVEFGRKRGARVLLVDDGHRLAKHVDWVAAQFGLYLQGLVQGGTQTS